MTSTSPTAILLLVCPDQVGIIHKLSQFVVANAGSIVDSDFHTDKSAGLFLGRLEWSLESFAIPREHLSSAVATVCAPLNGKAELFFNDVKTRVAIFCSKQDHCLLDLLWRYKAKELFCDIVMIVSNHEDLKPHAEQFDIPYYTFKPDKDRPDGKAEMERQQLELLKRENVDLVIMAKYMQILTDNFVKTFPNVINIHHSFLPAFIGAKPYHQAFARGVKLIGATAHFATAELDAGPIIEQETVRVSHRDTVEDLVRKGADTERLVLSRAVRLHLLHRVLTYGNKTVVFE